MEFLAVSSESVMAARNGERLITRKEKSEAARDYRFRYIKGLTI